MSLYLFFSLFVVILRCFAYFMSLCICFVFLFVILHIFVAVLHISIVVLCLLCHFVCVYICFCLVFAILCLFVAVLHFSLVTHMCISLYVCGHFTYPCGCFACLLSFCMSVLFQLGYSKRVKRTLRNRLFLVLTGREHQLLAISHCRY